MGSDSPNGTLSTHYYLYDMVSVIYSIVSRWKDIGETFFGTPFNRSTFSISANIAALWLSNTSLDQTLSMSTGINYPRYYYIAVG
jgi:hypothetical protein